MMEVCMFPGETDVVIRTDSDEGVDEEVVEDDDELWETEKDEIELVVVELADRLEDVGDESVEDMVELCGEELCVEEDDVEELDRLELEEEVVEVEEVEVASSVDECDDCADELSSSFSSDSST
ncbi:hypothetical protein OGATHE_005675 [Ogataea polymorpha]|uniref:Uncharacterized protein n=1 Tax=Ogataea polymorpha TaxID=460523 RepID=A0A9P8SZA3_9ASCO|nr:hypothetical protein OGATHE_005675 [Ogataea polymorpha]